MFAASRSAFSIANKAAFRRRYVLGCDVGVDVMELVPWKLMGCRKNEWMDE